MFDELINWWNESYYDLNPPTHHLIDLTCLEWDLLHLSRIENSSVALDYKKSFVGTLQSNTSSTQKRLPPTYGSIVGTWRSIVDLDNGDMDGHEYNLWMVGREDWFLCLSTSWVTVEKTKVAYGRNPFYGTYMWSIWDFLV